VLIDTATRRFQMRQRIELRGGSWVSPLELLSEIAFAHRIRST
jgi:hypothetical protein